MNARRFFIALSASLVVIAIGLCLLWVLLSLAVSQWAAAGTFALRYRLSTEACVGLRTAAPPGWGIGWYSPVIAYNMSNPPPFHWGLNESVLVCSEVFWLPVLPPYGSFVLPF